MSRLSRPSFRFVLEAVLIVLTAVVTGLMHLSAWAIAAAVFFVWIESLLVLGLMDRMMFSLPLNSSLWSIGWLGLGLISL